MIRIQGAINNNNNLVSDTTAPKKWCFWTVMLEKTPESALDSKEIKPVNPKGNQWWIFIGRTHAEADVKNWVLGKDPDTRNDWRQEKGMTEDEMVGWHHQVNAHEFEEAPGVDDGQGSPACCRPWGCKETRLSDWTDWQWWFLSLCHELMYVYPADVKTNTCTWATQGKTRWSRNYIDSWARNEGSCHGSATD